jgi:hypothetical protein
MKPNILMFIDWGRGAWTMQYRNAEGEMISEPTGFPASTPSIMVCDEMQKAHPQVRVFAKLN